MNVKILLTILHYLLSSTYVHKRRLTIHISMSTNILLALIYIIIYSIIHISLLVII